MAKETTIARESRVNPINAVSSRTMAYGSDVTGAISDRAIHLHGIASRDATTNRERWLKNAERITRATNNMLARSYSSQSISSSQERGITTRKKTEDEQFLESHKSASFVGFVQVGNRGTKQYFTDRIKFQRYRDKAWESGHPLQIGILKEHN